eukprot:6173184-Pleurochrysis_carterae.AAC.8
MRKSKVRRRKATKPKPKKLGIKSSSSRQRGANASSHCPSESACARLVLAQVDIARLDQLAPERLRRVLVSLLGRADELVAREVVERQQRSERLGDLVGKGLRRLPRCRCRLLHLLPMLIRPRQEEHVVPVEPREARHDITRQRRVHVADVRLAVDVVDGRRNKTCPSCTQENSSCMHHCLHRAHTAAV